MVVVVSDTSPIRALAHLSRTELLRDLYGTVLIPPGVADELNQPSTGGPVVNVDTIPYLQVREPGDRNAVNRFLQSLDLGESEALALAEELDASILLMDEAAGRAVGQQLRFLVVGTCGVLLRAKQRGLIAELKPLLDDLINNLGFFVSRRLRSQVLAAAGESA